MPMPFRRLLTAFTILLAVLGALPSARAAELPPIVFVHGNGDTAALWTVQMWRFESNGYPRGKLFALDLPNPTARDVDAVPQAGRTSTGEARAALSDFVDAVLKKTGARKVALVGNSRGSTIIRNYLKNGGGAAKVSHAVLGGGVNHGVVVSDVILIGSEFNGASDFIRQLNAGPNEVVPGVKFLTLRSDFNDKFAQPDGAALGLPGFPTGVSFDAPALNGATNRVLPGVDHRETSYNADAFTQTFRWITGRSPARTSIIAERRPILDGTVTGITAGVYDNKPVAGAEVQIYRVDPATGKRIGGRLHRKRTDETGRWGPFLASPTASYEFVVFVVGQPVAHIYRSPFPRSSAVVHLRPAMADASDAGAGAVVEISRPRGYFDRERDTVLLDGAVPEGVPAGVATASTAKKRYPFFQDRPIVTRFNGETIVIRPWMGGGVQLSTAEFHY